MTLQPDQLKAVIHLSVLDAPVGRGKEAEVYAVHGYPALVLRGKKSTLRVPNNPKALYVEYGGALEDIHNSNTLGVPLVGIVDGHSELAEASFLTRLRALDFRRGANVAILRRCTRLRAAAGCIDAYDTFAQSLKHASQTIARILLH